MQFAGLDFCQPRRPEMEGWPLRVIERGRAPGPATLDPLNHPVGGVVCYGDSFAKTVVVRTWSVRPGFQTPFPSEVFDGFTWPDSSIS